ncbi:MAG TPA: UDP-glucose 4-epimerase GalE [Azospirillaceae bacterium]|nr:UDP-glucose 4-epimerase GalE [Azospirillaceae bacterium]
MTRRPVENPVVLVTGGAGYIGSHAVLALREAGIKTVVIDNLSTGRRQSVPPDVSFVEGDIADTTLVSRVMRAHRISAVMHFAGSIVVPESVRRPLDYYQNNTAKTLALIQTAVACGVGGFIFSSTAAVYGEAAVVPIPEDAPTSPINPYGSSKLMSERMLRDAGLAHGLKYAVLRYFNVAGADPQGRAGQASPESTHLIKIASEVAVGAREEMAIFGDDYPTPDGTCVRDYIHVSDLADAHVAALRYLLKGGESVTLNCGYGHGASVREVIEAMERVLGRPLPVRVGPRRPGDPPELVAGCARIRETLGWTPRYDDLLFIVATALSWERRLRRDTLAA